MKLIHENEELGKFLDKVIVKSMFGSPQEVAQLVLISRGISVALKMTAEEFNERRRELFEELRGDPSVTLAKYDVLNDYDAFISPRPVETKVVRFPSNGADE